MEYIPNYPIAEYRIDEEVARNPSFKTFVEVVLILCISYCAVFDLCTTDLRPSP